MARSHYLNGSNAAFHEIWSLSMSTLLNDALSIPRPPGADRALRGHQSDYGPLPAARWREWWQWSERQRQRIALRELADDQHLLDDLGITREQALDEADKPFWR
jgi:uncharacterized protein YjiS (DUF1127 family)